MTFEFILFLIIGAAAGGFVNGLAGFGTSLFALGWWLQVMAPLEAIVLALILTVMTGAQATRILWHSIRPRRLARFLLPALIGMPFGLMALPYVQPVFLKLLVAGLLVFYGGLFAFRRTVPRISGPAFRREVFVGFIGGVLGSMAGLAGAIPTMWCALRDWSKDERRAVMQPYNMTVMGLTAIILAFSGMIGRDDLIRVAIAFPVSFTFAQIGLWLFGKMEENQFTRLLIGLLLLSGLVLLANVILQELVP